VRPSIFFGGGRAAHFDAFSPADAELRSHATVFYLLFYSSLLVSLVPPTGALPAIKPEATALGFIARWPLLENNLNLSWSQVLRTEILRYSRRHVTKLLRCDWLGRIRLIITQQSAILR